MRPLRLVTAASVIALSTLLGGCDFALFSSNVASEQGIPADDITRVADQLLNAVARNETNDALRFFAADLPADQSGELTVQNLRDGPLRMVDSVLWTKRATRTVALTRSTGTIEGIARLRNGDEVPIEVQLSSVSTGWGVVSIRQTGQQRAMRRTQTSSAAETVPPQSTGPQPTAVEPGRVEPTPTVTKNSEPVRVEPTRLEAIPPAATQPSATLPPGTNQTPTPRTQSASGPAGAAAPPATQPTPIRVAQAPAATPPATSRSSTPVQPAQTAPQPRLAQAPTAPQPDPGVAPQPEPPQPEPAPGQPPGTLTVGPPPVMPAPQATPVPIPTQPPLQPRVLAPQSPQPQVVQPRTTQPQSPQPQTVQPQVVQPRAGTVPFPPPVAAADIPDEPTRIRLVQETMHQIVGSLQANDFTALHSNASSFLQQSQSVTELERVLRIAFRGMPTGVNVLRDRQPRLIGQPFLGQDGMWRQQGVFELGDRRLAFRFAYTAEDGVWKLGRFIVQQVTR